MKIISFVIAILSASMFAQDSIELGQSSTGNKSTFIDFRSDDTYTDYGFRIWRTNAGPNADSMFVHRGQGGLNLMLLDNAGSINMSNAATTFVTVRGDNGQVGIGTTSPAAKLDVKGHVVIDALMGAGWGGPVLWLSSATTDQSRYLLIANSPHTSMASGIKAGGMLCADALNYANPDKNTLIVKGNVGIGTASPQEKLHVEGGNIRITGSNQATNTPVGITTHWDNSYLTFRSGSTATVFSEIGLRGNYNGVGNAGGYIDFKTAGTERFRITETGESKFKGRVITQNASAEATGNAPSADFHLQGTGASTEMVLHSTRGGNQGASESKISFKTGYWCSNGAQIAGVKDPTTDVVKVVIRTIDGQYNLQDRVTIGPYGNMSVQGTLSAQEVKVTTTGFPDYVFAPDYKLRSLVEVERHIREHRHLPGVPSAAEVEKDGLALSEMSKKQMEKIEELTLYAIEQQKENHNLRKRVEKLEQLIERLVENKK